MTTITGPVQNVAGELLDGTLKIQSSRWRESSGSDAAIAPDPKTFAIVDGALIDATDIDPGRATLLLQVGSGTTKPLTVDIPDVETVTLRELIASVEQVDPPVATRVHQDRLVVEGLVVEAQGILEQVEGGAVPDALVAAHVESGTSETRTALNSIYAPASGSPVYATPATVTTQVPPLVTTALAADSTIQAAASSAAATAVNSAVSSGQVKAGYVPAIGTAVGAGTRTNLARNPSLTTALSRWTASAGTGGAASATRVASTITSGFSAKATWTTGTSDASGGIYATGAPVAAGNKYGVSIIVKPSVARKLRIVWTWRTAADAWISDVAETSVDVAAGVATTLTSAKTAPATAGLLTVAVYAVTTGTWAAGDTLEATNLLIEQIDSAATAPGTFFDGEGTTAYWSGTRGDSTSSILVPTALPAFTVSRTAGKVSSVTEAGVTTTYGRDTAGRVTTITTGGKTQTLTRDATGRITGGN